MTMTTIGLDLAKSVFQAHGVDENGATILVKRLHRKMVYRGASGFHDSLPAPSSMMPYRGRP